jgi:hypothetical protein
MCVHARQVWEIGLQQIISPYHEVTLLVALDVDVGDLEVAIYGTGELLVHGEHLEGIADGDRIEHGFEIVVTVGATLYDVETKIDFSYWKC